LYFLGLSFRNIAKALYFLLLVKISHVSIWNLIQKYKPTKKYRKNKKIIEYSCIQKDETSIKTASKLVWLWIVIEPNDKEILAVDISKERNMFVVAERFLSHVLDKYGKHQVSSDGGGTWYPQACKFFESVSSSSFLF
jgi:putative transposase